MNKSARLLVVVGFVLAGAALAYAGSAPEGFKSVADVARDPVAFDGQRVDLKATVLEGSLLRGNETIRFVAIDGVHELPVVWDPAIPLPEHEAGGTIEGRSIVVSGTVLFGDDGPYLLADDMKVGCASKYEAA